MATQLKHNTVYHTECNKDWKWKDRLLILFPSGLCNLVWCHIPGAWAGLISRLHFKVCLGLRELSRMGNWKTPLDCSAWSHNFRMQEPLGRKSCEKFQVAQLLLPGIPIKDCFLWVTPPPNHSILSTALLQNLGFVYQIEADGSSLKGKREAVMSHRHLAFSLGTSHSNWQPRKTAFSESHEGSARPN